MEAGTSVKSIYAQTLNITILAQTKTHKIRPLYPGPYERHPHDIHAWRSPAFPHPGRPAPALHDLTERAGRNRARRLAPARFHRLRRGAVPSSRSALRCGPPGTFHGSRAHGRRSLAVVHGDGAGNARAHCCRTRPVHHTREGRRAGKHASAPGLKNWPEPGDRKSVV